MTLARPSAAAPFGTIALCLSGGGYRAATYALGSIDMLELAGVLKDVKLMSTVSGGTFTGVTYALSVAKTTPYGEFYDRLNSFLRETNCVELALQDLYKTPSPSGRKDLSLIRSAAEVYNNKLFAAPGETFSALQSVVGDGKRFVDLIHNATEFRKGNSFRFRASQITNVFAGNGDFKVTREIAGKILLADVVAASSCFPGAFEPIRFPDDFMWTESMDSIKHQLMEKVRISVKHIDDDEADELQLSAEERVKEFIFRPSGFKNAEGECISMPLMDGGIYDNQGISNAVMADRTVDDAKHRIVDLFLICDTSARNNDMLRYPKPDTRAGWLSINMLFWLAVGLFVLSVTSVAFLIYYLATAVDTKTLSWTRFIFQYLSPIFLFVVLIGILIWGYRLFSKNKEIVVSGAKFKLWPIVRRLALPDLIDMIKARVTSLGTMAGDVFMKRIRQLQFNDIMSSTRGPKVSFDLIYELNPTKKDRSDLWELDPELRPTDAMKELSACAERVPTTLWFPKKGDEVIEVETIPDTCKEKHPDEQKLLIACAQCTTCFCLIKHLWRRWQDEHKSNPTVPKPNDPLSPFYQKFVDLHEIWTELKKNPYALVERKRDAALP